MTQERKFTPGPWVSKHDADSGHYDIRGAARGAVAETIAQVHYVQNKPGGRGEADAHLIAAAPELFEALGSAPIIGPTESASSFRQRQDEWLRNVCNPAIAKARGET